MIISRHHSPVERADRFLRSPSGRALIHRTLARAHLPQSLADDLSQDALRRLWVAMSSSVAIDDLEAFVATLLHRGAVDIVRGRIRSPQAIDWSQVVDPDAGGHGGPLDGASPLDVEADALGGRSVAAVRRALHLALSIDPAAAAAALAYLAVAVDGAPVASDCPQPARGATLDEATEWAALWYAGHARCFAPPGSATATAVRQRRSRLARRLRGRLELAARTVGLEPEGVSRG